MVLIIVSVAGLAGITYMTASTLKAASSANLVQASRAKYLAESAVQHGAYLLHSGAAGPLRNSSPESPLGPFYLDESDDSYVVWAHHVGDVGTWVVTGQGRVGEAVQTVSARMFVGPPDVTGGQTVLSDAPTARIPAGVSVFGSVSVRGRLENYGHVEGDLASSEAVSVAGRHGGEVSVVSAADIPNPRIDGADYVTYRLDGQTYTASRMSGALPRSSVLTRGGSATSENPAGVVVIEPAGQSMPTITADTDFTGTIVVMGDVVIDGSNIRLRSQRGFPALVCDGCVYVTDGTELEVFGLVAAGGGIVRCSEGVVAKTKIHGSLVTRSGLFDDLLEGTHELYFDPDAGRLFDVTTGSNLPDVVRILDWYEP